MNPKYKIGDLLSKKGARDYPVMEITEIIHTPFDVAYKLKPVKGIGNVQILGEDAIDELYYVVKISEK